jgi:hypothetical protein
VTIRKRRDGWQVIVYAGLDPLTGKQVKTLGELCDLWIERRVSSDKPISQTRWRTTAA